MSFVSMIAVVISLLFAVSAVDDYDEPSASLFHVGPDKVNWMGANKYCQQTKGWQLASIHNDDENHYAVEVVLKQTSGKAEVWIGGVRSHTDLSRFEWSDGTKWRYTKWAKKQPGNRNEKCVTFGNGKWHDYSCSRQFYPLCRKKARPNPKGQLTYHGLLSKMDRSMGRCEAQCQHHHECWGALVCGHQHHNDITGCVGSRHGHGYCIDKSASTNGAATGGDDVTPHFNDDAFSNDDLALTDERKWNPMMIGAVIGVGAVAILVSVALLVASKRRKREMGSEPTKEKVAEMSCSAVEAPVSMSVMEPVTTELESETVAAPEPDDVAIAVE